jgi:hypothetical protein
LQRKKYRDATKPLPIIFVIFLNSAYSDRPIEFPNSNIEAAKCTSDSFNT